MDEDSTADNFFNDLLAAVEQQLASPATAYVAKTFARLVKEGLSAEEAREAIARCLAEETDAMYRRQAPFDEKAYRTRLEMTKGSE